MHQLDVLGPLRLRFDGRSIGPHDFVGSKPREVLCVLAANAGRPVLKETLAGALWEPDPPASWRSTLEGYVSLLRRTLQPGVRARDSVVLTRSGSYQLDTDQVGIDLVRFNELALHADTVGGAAASAALEAALGLVRGELLQGERTTPWVDRLRVQHAKRARRVAIRAAELALASSRLDDALRYAEPVCESDEVCEDAWRVAIEAHWRAGRRSEALRCVQQVRANLAAELGIAPGAAIERLYVRILRDEAVAVA